MLRRLMATKGAKSLFAKCPADLPSNEWYSKHGFELVGRETTKSGRSLIHWRMSLETQPYRANIGKQLEVIYCAGNNNTRDEIALDAGLLLGVSAPDNDSRYRPYFVDQHPKKTPTKEDYIAAVAEHRPRMATVIDWTNSVPLETVLSWAEGIAPYVETIVIIPKVKGGITQLPRTISGKPVRLGYSIPTTHERTDVPLTEFEGWPIHLLGGSPEKQLELYKALDVRSVDANMMQKQATERCQFWSAHPVHGAANKQWPTLREAGLTNDGNANDYAFKISCINIMAAWRDAITVSQRSSVNDVSDLPLFAMAVA